MTGTFLISGMRPVVSHTGPPLPPKVEISEHASLGYPELHLSPPFIYEEGGFLLTSPPKKPILF